MSVALMSPEDIETRMGQALLPIIERLDAIEKRLIQGKICYSTKEIGELLSVSPRCVCTWVKDGKTDKNGRKHYLDGRELVKGRYVIELSAVSAFISNF